MQKKVVQCLNKGMRKDVSISKETNEFAFHNHNIRITARDRDTLLSVTNEKGTKEIELISNKETIEISYKSLANNQFKIVSEKPVCSALTGKVTFYNNTEVTWNINAGQSESINYTVGSTNPNIIVTITSPRYDSIYSYYTENQTPDSNANNEVYIYGTLLGYSVLNDYLVLFTKSEENDYIYRIKYVKNNPWEILILASGDFNFDYDYPIETLANYESEEIQKVYWVDGLNQPRMINIGTPKYYTANSFEFVSSVKDSLKYEVTKQYSGVGYYLSGTIQYFFTYHNKFGQETNVVASTPLYYISPKNRGGDADEICNCNFNINLSNVSRDFDYINIYAIHRSAINGTPAGYKVASLNIEDSIISYEDNGANLTAIDPTELLFKGGQRITANTITAKDGTLFLGGIKTQSLSVDSYIKDTLRNSISSDGFTSTLVSFIEEEEALEYSNPEDLYPYNSQLDKSSKDIKFFKGGERYRFAVRFKDTFGNETPAYWIGDVDNTIYPNIVKNTGNKHTITRSIARLSFESLGSAFITYLKNQKYTAIQLLIAEPSDSDRSIKAQGWISPTMFNFKQRTENAPFAISSWFTRIQSSDLDCGHYTSTAGSYNSNGEFQGNVDKVLVTYDEDSEENAEEITFGSSWSLEYWFEAGGRDVRVTLYNSPTQSSSNLKIVQQKKTGWKMFENNAAESAIAILEEMGVIIPPSLTIDSLRDLLKDCRVKKKWTTIPGYDKETNYKADVPIGTSTQTEARSYKYKTYYGQDNSIVTFHSPEIEFSTTNYDNSNLKFRIIGTAPITAVITDYSMNTTRGFYSGTGVAKLNFSKQNLTTDITGLISYPLYKDINDLEKTLPTNFTIYPWHKEGSISKVESASGEEYAELKDKIIGNLRFSYYTRYTDPSNFWESPNGIFPIRIYDYDTQQLVSFETPWGIKAYQGNYDYMIAYDSNEEYPILGISESEFNNSGIIRYSDVKEGYTTTDPIRIKYKSAKHALISLKIKPDDSFTISTIPTKGSSSKTYLGNLPWSPEGEYYYSSGKIFDTHSETSLDVPSVFIGELYEEVDNPYGGYSESALEANTFIPTNDYIDINDNITTIYKGLEGDTYFQRYDTVKTYPFDKEDTNSVVETVSIMLETHINLDGRTSRRRTGADVANNVPSSTTELNEVYSQTNNFRTSFILDDKFALNSFPQQIVWSKTKAPTEEVDTWTNINLASTMDLDGDKGPVRAIRRFGNSLIAFQDKGISEILFNSRTQLATNAGIPIEIANSGKVDGKNYITNSYGCSNKWSIVEGRMGLYFIDDITKNLCLLSNGIMSLSDDKGFSTWVKSVSDNLPWNPQTFNNVVASYDKINGDVYFTTKDTTLCYSEVLQEFVSFYDYNRVPMMCNFNDTFISYKHNKLWEHEAGEYNNLHGSNCDYYMTYKVNPTPSSDKIFSTIEYRADIWKDNTLTNDTFDTLEVWNEYQSGITSLKDKHKYPNFEKKFRIWRIDIPRDNKKPIDRMRNPWLNIKLFRNPSAPERMELHDILVHYYE